MSSLSIYLLLMELLWNCLQLSLYDRRDLFASLLEELYSRILLAFLLYQLGERVLKTFKRSFGVALVFAGVAV